MKLLEEGSSLFCILLLGHVELTMHIFKVTATC